MGTASPGAILDQYSLSDHFRPPPHVVWVRHPGTTVVLDADRGLYYTLNDDAGRVWELLTAGEPVIEILRVMGDEYDVGPGLLAADVAALLSEMEAAKLIERVGR